MQNTDLIAGYYDLTPDTLPPFYKLLPDGPQ